MNTEQTPDIVRETIQARYDFTDSEKLRLGESLVASMANSAQIEREFDSVKSEFKMRREKAELETETLQQKLSDGFEMRETRAGIAFNLPIPGRKTYFALDAEGWLDFSRPLREEGMTHADMERPLFRTEDGKDATEPEPQESDEPKEGADYEVADELPPEMPPAGDGDAGTTPLGDALDAAAAKLNVPLLKIPLDEPGWQKSGLIAEVKKQGKLAKWPAAAISCLVDQLNACESVESAKQTLRPHVAQPEAE